MLDIIDEKDVKKTKDIKKAILDRICIICGSNKTGLTKIGNPHWLKYYDEKGNWDEKSYICTVCYMNAYKNLPDSTQHFRKMFAKSRTGNFSRFERPGKTVIGQWIVAKTLGLKDLNIYNNNFREPIDLSSHPVYGNIDVKIATYNHINDQWRFEGIRHNFDNLFIICMDRYEPWNDVEMVFKVPIIYINTDSITIIKNLSSRGSKWKNFRIDRKPYNDTYHSVNIPEFFSPFYLWKGMYDR